MQIAHGALLALFITAASLGAAGTARAADDDGRIASVDREALTITLDNGNTYKLPIEVDLEAIEEGMEIVLAYEDVESERQVTDMALFE